jgi:hypothetical protein
MMAMMKALLRRPLRSLVDTVTRITLERLREEGVLPVSSPADHGGATPRTDVSAKPRLHGDGGLSRIRSPTTLSSYHRST